MVEDYRRNAQFARERAERALTSEQGAAWLKLAAEWEALADADEVGAPKPVYRALPGQVRNSRRRR